MIYYKCPKGQGEKKMKCLTLKDLVTGEYKSILVKRWWPTKTGLIYINLFNELKDDLQNYVNDSNMVLYCVE